MGERAKFVFTSNNWGKNVFDATEKMRRILFDSGICDYEEMENGRDNGMLVPIQIRVGELRQMGQMSIYRSKTRGDPRFGISNVKDLGDIDDEMEVYFDEEEGNIVCVILDQTHSPSQESFSNDNWVDQYPLPEEYNDEDEPATQNAELVLTQETIGSLLDGNQIYVMPMFQRRFKWEKPQFDDLWKDIDDIWHRTETSQFLGAILLSVSKGGAGSTTQENWVIDGQQRITTLYALICAITKTAQDNGYPELADLFSDPLIVSKGAKKGYPTISPTLSDTKQFNDILKQIKSTIGDAKLADDKGSNVRLINAWKKDLMQGVIDRVTNESGTADEEKLEYLFEIVKDRLFFTMMVLPGELNPYMIFERLNNTGKKLSAADLVRNLIFEKLIDMPDAAESLYNDEMLHYEESFNYSKNNKSKSKLDEFYFPFALTRSIENVTKARMYNQLRKYWHNKTSLAMITELSEISPVYIALCKEFPEEKILPGEDPIDPIRENTEIWDRLLRLRRFDPPTTTFPFLMQLLQYYRNERDNEDEIVKSLDIIEAYLVRRNICSLQNAGFTNFFRGMWKACGEVPNSAKLLNKLKTTSGYEYPDDEMVAKELSKTDIYSKRSLARFILNEFEMHDEGDGHNNDYVLENYWKSTIEHIIPAEPENWIKRMKTWEITDDATLQEVSSGGPIYERWHARYKHTIGNLTILTHYENSEASNYDWDPSFEMTESDEKCKKYYYASQAKYRKIKQIAENFSSGYDNKSHDKRSAELIDWIIQRWSSYSE
tara:strand:+ start:504 stop:2822 length:2319 start_codon:yes stop_codon:yes gene_type:complete